MPESTLDRLVLVLGICVLAGLVALIVPEWRSYTSAGDPAVPASAPRPVKPPPPSAPVTPPVASGQTATTAAKRPRARRTAPPRVARLRLVAARGDSWVEARSGSASGRQIYLGILAQGRELRLSGRAVWLRLGAPQNLAGWIGTKRVRNLPLGAATVIATPAGVRTLALG